MNRIVENLNNVARQLSLLATQSKVRVAFYTVQSRFHCQYEPKLVEIDGVEFRSVTPEELGGAGDPFDVILIGCHNSNEDRLFFELRRRARASLFVAWMWDNHHHHVNNLRTAISTDVVLVSHWFDRFPMMSQGTVLGPHLPLPTRQWSPEGLEACYPDGLPVSRRDELFGGFGAYSFTPERMAFLQGCQTTLKRHSITLVRDIGQYFERPYADRLREWVDHKVHLIAPVNRDVSCRLFEALAVGQIPIVADDMPDLDVVIPPAIQAQLPVLRFRPNSVDSALDAYREALRRFDAEGQAGVTRRQRFACDHNSVGSRLAACARMIRGYKNLVLVDSDGVLGVAVQTG